MFPHFLCIYVQHRKVSISNQGNRFYFQLRDINYEYSGVYNWKEERQEMTVNIKLLKKTKGAIVILGKSANGAQINEFSLQYQPCN